MRNFTRLVYLLSLTGCAGFSIPSRSVNSAQEVAWDRQLTQAESLLEKEQWEPAKSTLQEFLTTSQLNRFTNRAKVDLAETLNATGQFQQALALLQEVTASAVTASSLEKQETFFARASFVASSSYEGLGQFELALAALQDAERRKEFLPPVLAKAELPARLAITIHRVQNGALAKPYFAQAQSGVESLFRGATADDHQARARTYQAMGQYSMLIGSSDEVDVASQKDPEARRRLLADIEAFEYVQFFSLRAIEENDPKWSTKALDDLTRAYRSLWNRSMRFRQGAGPEATPEPLVQLTVSMEKLKSLHLAVLDNAYSQQLLTFLATLQGQAEELLMQAEDLTPLTPEARRRESLRREGVVYSLPVFQREKKELQQQKLLRKKPQVPLNLPENPDPNLNAPKESSKGN